jgi:hypothetical protein
MKKLLVLVALVALLQSPIPANAEASANVIRNVSVGDSPISVVVDATAKKVFVAVEYSKIKVINEKTGKFSQVTGYDRKPLDMALDEVRHEIYVTNLETNDISVIDVASNRVTSTIPVEDSFQGTNDLMGVAVDSARGRVYVTFWPAGSLLVFDTKTKALIKTVTLANGVSGVAVEPSTGRICVSNGNTGTVTILEPKTWTTFATIKVGKEPTEISIDANGVAYVSNFASNSVSMIEIKTKKLMRTIKVGLGPLALALRSKTSELYVANFLGDSVSVISTKTMQVTRTFKGASHPRDIQVNGLTGVAYIANMWSGVLWTVGGRD